MRKTPYPKNRKVGRPIGSTVLRAREALQAHAAEAAKLVVEAARVSAKRGNYTAAAWLLEHTSETVDGKEIRPIAPGIDRQQIESGSRGLTVNVGWVGAPGALQADNGPIIEVSPIETPALPPHNDEGD